MADPVTMWSSFTITENGLALRQKAIALGLRPTFVFAEIGEGVPPDPSQIPNMTALVQRAEQVQVTRSMSSGTTHHVDVQIDNMGFNSPVLMREMGVFAAILPPDPEDLDFDDFMDDEKKSALDDPELPQFFTPSLYGYAYTTSGYESIPPGEEFHRIWTIGADTQISRSESIAIKYDGSIVYVTHEDIDALRQMVQKVTDQMSTLGAADIDYEGKLLSEVLHEIETQISTLDVSGIMYGEKTLEEVLSDIAEHLSTLEAKDITYEDKSLDVILHEFDTQLRGIANKNLLINGGFEIWQRGVSLAGGGYLADRWMCWANSSTVTQARSEDVPNTRSKYSLLFTKISGTGEPYVSQFIERPELYHNMTATWSVWVKADPGVSAYIYIRDNNSVGRVNFVGDGLWHKYEATCMPQTTDGSASLSVRFNSGNPAGVRMWVTQAKLEPGERATPFVPRQPGEELALCQRYYFKNHLAHNEAFLRAGYVASGSWMKFHVPTPVSMRINPTIVGTLAVLSFPGNAAQTGFTFSVEARAEGLIIIAIKDAHGLTDALLALDRGVAFDAEL